MIALKLALRNLLGAGLRTWLNVLALSFSFVVIIWNTGMLHGWNAQAKRDMTNWQIGQGQYWHPAYDPYDPFTLQDSHSTLPPAIRQQVASGNAVPQLIHQAAIYPNGRMKSVLLRGIEPNQHILLLPTSVLAKPSTSIPVLIGKRMAKSCNLHIGDRVMVRWRDVNGTFDAAEMEIMEIFSADVPAVDSGQVWLPIDRLRQMTQMPGQATLVVKGDVSAATDSGDWVFRGTDYLMKEITEIIRMKNIGSSIFYFFLLVLALLALFDTQVLSIFRRQREIGTIVALGMTRGQVVALFTFEGALHSLLAALLAVVYGGPFLAWQAVSGFKMPQATDNMGMAISERIYPVYGLGLILFTLLLVVISATIVSYLPARRIAYLKPTDAIRGKLQ